MLNLALASDSDEEYVSDSSPKIMSNKEKKQATCLSTGTSSSKPEVQEYPGLSSCPSTFGKKADFEEMKPLTKAQLTFTK